MNITISDLRKAILHHGDVSTFLPALSPVLGNPPVKILSELGKQYILPDPDVLTNYFNPHMTDLLKKNTGITPDKAKLNKANVKFIKLSGDERYSELEKLIEQNGPDIIAVDTSSLNFSINLAYVFSMFLVTGIPVSAEVFSIKDNSRYTMETIYSGSTLQLLILESWFSRIPMIPLNIPFSLDPETMNISSSRKRKKSFYTNPSNIGTVDESEQEFSMSNGVLDTYSGEVALVSRQDILIDEASYIASRVSDLESLPGTSRGHSILVFVSADHYQPVLDFIELIDKGITEDVYQLPRNDTNFSDLEVIFKNKPELYIPNGEVKNIIKIQDLFTNELENLVKFIESKQPTDEQLYIVIAEIIRRTRDNKEIKRGASVRGALAIKEILDGFKQLENGINLKTLEKSALIALPYRIKPKRDGYESAREIVSIILKEVLFNMRFSSNLFPVIYACDNAPASPSKQKLSAQSQPKDADNVNKPESSSKNDSVIVKKTGSNASKYDNSNNGFKPEESLVQDEYLSSLTQAIERNKLAGKGPNNGSSAKNNNSEASLNLSNKDMANAVLEIMDVKDKQWQKTMDLNDIYIYYHLRQNQDKLIQPQCNYADLKVIINSLQEKGLLNYSDLHDDYSLTSQALDLLLDQLIINNVKGKELEMLLGHTKRSVVSREESRPYRKGDVFRNISLRHTLREVVRNGKKLSAIDRNDFKIYMKQKCKVQSDIALCVDSSSSMGYQQKLLLARLTAAGLIKAAITQGDQLGITTFDDVSQIIIPLSTNKNDLFNRITGIKAGGNTNIGEGIKGSAEMLLRVRNPNHKSIILITDGQPTAISEKSYSNYKQGHNNGASEEDAINETRRAASRGIKTSVIYISDNKKEKLPFVKGIAAAGKGVLKNIQTLEDLATMIRK